MVTMQKYKIADMLKLVGNPRKISQEEMECLKESLQSIPEYFEAHPIVMSNRTGKWVVIDGNQRMEAARQLGWEEVPVALMSGLTEEKEREIIIRANVNNGEWDMDLLKEWDKEQLEDWGVDVEWEEENEDIPSTGAKGSLAEKFGIIPFSVLDTRKGEWQSRKNEWISLGIKSEIGRAENLAFSKSSQPPKAYVAKNHLREKLNREPTWDETIKYCEDKGMKLHKGTSIFDPVLCEMMYRWFNVNGGVVLDPFAGGSVRGIVAAKLGMPYNGCDLRQEQITANIENGKEVLTEVEPFPNWVCGDSCDIDKHLKGVKADMIMTCPPYADLEVYSDNPKDLSTMDYKDFLEVYRKIIKKTADMLKENRFAVFVVGEVRDKKGNYYNFVGDTIKAGIDAGLKYYNEIILVNATSSLAIRLSQYMNNSRKVGKHHQNVIIFYKDGGAKKIKDEFPAIDLREEDIKAQIEAEEGLI